VCALFFAAASPTIESKPAPVLQQAAYRNSSVSRVEYKIMTLFDEITDGRTDLVFEYLAEGHSANSVDNAGVSLVQWCAYYGDVSAIKFLMAKGATLKWRRLGVERCLLPWALAAMQIPD
jgi:hypothetical protein